LGQRLFNSVNIAVAATSTTGSSDHRQRDKAGNQSHVPLWLRVTQLEDVGPRHFIGQSLGIIGEAYISTAESSVSRDSESRKDIHLFHNRNEALVFCMASGVRVNYMQFWWVINQHRAAASPQRLSTKIPGEHQLVLYRITLIEQVLPRSCQSMSLMAIYRYLPADNQNSKD
jgi:hypothetical protein